MKLSIVLPMLLLFSSKALSLAQEENKGIKEIQQQESIDDDIRDSTDRRLQSGSISDIVFGLLFPFEVCRGQTTLRLDFFSMIFGMIFLGDSWGACPAQDVPADDSFDITLQILGSPEDESVFVAAKTRWESIITAGYEGEVPGSDIPPVDELVDAGCMYPNLVDDLYICGAIQPIDGPGNVLGSAGPSLTFSSGPNNGLPVIGFMRFDEADIEGLRAGGTLNDIILHEMAHVLGIGTLWNFNNVAGTDEDDCPYTGSSANREYEEITSCTAVPTEQDFGPGTRCGHWDEDCLGTELMTGIASPSGTESPLSRITIGTLEDMGYQVDYTQADAYGVDDIGAFAGCVCNRRGLSFLCGAHGETKQLGLGSPKTKARRLSEAARATAIEYGTAQLAKRSESFQGIRQPGSGVEYVGDKVISVIVQDDDGSIFRIIVHAD